MQDKIRCAIYTRVSTDSQAEVEFNSCETQELKMRSFISSQENMAVYKVYSDQGYSGASLNRPALMEMLKDIKAKAVNVVIAYKIDRLTRSPKDFYQLIDVFDKYGVSFISVTEHFDTSTPSGRLLRNIMLTFAQFERELISERIRDKMLERAKKGFWNCGITPYGYNRENKKLVINQEEAKVVKDIFETYANTGSMSAVYHHLKDKNIQDRKGHIFSVETIAKMLKATVYMGKVPYHGQIYPGMHEPIITESLFNLVQGLHKEKVIKSIVPNHSLFTGLITCKECGSIMTFSFTNKLTGGRKLHYFYYRCSIINKRDSSFCDTRQVSIDRLDLYIIENLERIANDNFYLESLVFKLNHDKQGRLKGIEPSDQNSFYEIEKVKNILTNLTNIFKDNHDLAKRVLIKKYIKGIIYSKDAIELTINYPVYRKEKFTGGEVTAAACRAGAAGRRANPFVKEKTADFKNQAVRADKVVEVTGIEPVSGLEPTQDSYERRPDSFSRRPVTPGQVRGGQSP